MLTRKSIFRTATLKVGGKTMYSRDADRPEKFGSPGVAFVRALKVLINTITATSPKLNSLHAEKANATLGVSSEVLGAFLESREKAAMITGYVCPMCVEDLKWGID